VSKMTLPLAAMPAAISQSVADVLKVHGLTLTPDLLRELGNNVTQALYGLDVSLGLEEPSVGERFATGHSLVALAHAGHPNEEAASALGRVGEWLRQTALAELVAEKERAA